MLQFPTPEVKAAAAAADFAAAARSAYANAVVNPANGAATYAAAAYAAAAVADANYAAEAFGAAESAVVRSTFGAETDAAIWGPVRADARAHLSGKDLSVLPLWSETPPKWFISASKKTRDFWAEEPKLWSFWLRWWDGVLAGRPLDWELQKQVALIPDEVWKQGPAAVAGAIRDIETQYALATTDNAEAIEENSETGKLRLVPASHLPKDLGDYARRKILKAVDLFDDPGASQQYLAIALDLDMLRRAEADAGNLPVELYDACASATRRLAMRAEAGECPAPEKDPLLADYRNRLMDVAADILAHDPMTQDVLDRRNRIKGNTALIDGRVTLNIAVQIVLPGTEGRLADTLPQDGTLATDPQANPEDRKDASVRLAGRLLRIMVWMMKHPVKGAASIVVAGGLAQVGVRGADWVIDSASPQTVETLKAAWEIILRYLGL